MGGKHDRDYALRILYLRWHLLNWEARPRYDYEIEKDH
jgi:hypothetical protein